MKRYKVIVAASAQADIARSYEWGCRRWGKDQAQTWVRELRRVTTRQLAMVPRGFPLAPGNEESSVEIRQVIVGRYRVLFTIKEKNVFVLQCQRSLFCKSKG